MNEGEEYEENSSLSGLLLEELAEVTLVSVENDECPCVRRQSQTRP